MSVFSSSSAPKCWSDEWCWGLRVLPAVCTESVFYRQEAGSGSVLLEDISCQLIVQYGNHYLSTNNQSWSGAGVVLICHIYLCLCASFCLCVIIAQQECCRLCVLVLFIWKDSQHCSKEKCQSIDGYFICLFKVGGSLESAYSFSGIKILL